MVEEILQSCHTCRYWRNLQGQNGVCVFNPPISLIVGVQQVQMPAMEKGSLILQGKPQLVNQPVINSFFPSIGAAGWCGQWAVKDYTGERPEVSAEDYLTFKKLQATEQDEAASIVSVERH